MSFRGFTPETAPPRVAPAAPGPVPTLGALQRRDCKWVWAHCDPIRDALPCGHMAPLALAPFVIRWGPDVSSDVLRRNLRCTVCHGRGATIQHPSWVCNEFGWQPFPLSQSVIPAKAGTQMSARRTDDHLSITRKAEFPLSRE